MEKQGKDNCMIIKGVGKVTEAMFKAASKKANKLKKKKDKLEKESIVTAKKDPAVIAELKKMKPGSMPGIKSGSRESDALKNVLGPKDFTSQSSNTRGLPRFTGLPSKKAASSTASTKKLTKQFVKKERTKKRLMELNRKKNLTEAEKLEERGLKKDFGSIKSLQKETSKIKNTLNKIKKKLPPGVRGMADFSPEELKKITQSLNKKSGRRVGDKERKNLKRLKVDQRPKKRKQPIDPRDIFIEGPRTTGGNKGGSRKGKVIESLPTPRRGNGKLRGMGKALRGGGKVSRG
jgi:hypothetical protein